MRSDDDQPTAEMRAATDTLRELLTPMLAALGHPKLHVVAPNIQVMPWKGLYTHNWDHKVFACLNTNDDDFYVTLTATTVEAAVEQLLSEVSARVDRARKSAQEREDAARADRLRWEEADAALSEQRRARDIARREERDALDTPAPSAPNVLSRSAREKVCDYCGCKLATFLGGLEHHAGDCPNFPL